MTARRKTDHAKGGSIVLAAGGTGGHVFPAQALAGELIRRGHRLTLVTDSRTRAYGGTLGELDTHVVSAASPAGRNPFKKAVALVRIGLGVMRAFSILRHRSPSLVVGFGGYPSVPTVLAARLARVRAIVHEQNAVIGRANRLLAPGAAAIATSFPETQGLGAATARAVCTGNPVRSDIAETAAATYQPPGPTGEVRLLVTGGSQGARTLGRTVPAALALLPDSLRRRLLVNLQCRAEDVTSARDILAHSGIAGEVAAFFNDMPARLGAAHLVIARAGASTVAELAVAGRPALLVPYPHATDDHQSENARQISAAGGAEVIAEDAVAADTLATTLSELLGDDTRLSTLADGARRFGRPDAAEALADLAEAVISDSRNPTVTPARAA